MEKLVIKEVENKKYILINEKGKEYVLNLTFYDLEGELKVGDSISMHKELLDKKYYEYSKEYFFGPVNQKYGRKIIDADDVNVIAVQTQGKTIILKRFFG